MTASIAAQRRAVFYCVLYPLVAALIALALLPGCQSVKGSAIEPYARLALFDSVSARPTSYAYRDPDLAVMWLGASGWGEVGTKPTWLPLYALTLELGEAVAVDHEHDRKWKGLIGDPLPEWARGAFPPAQADAWGLTFFAEPSP